MNTTAFLEQMAEVLEVTPDTLTPDFQLNDTNFDSLALISTISLVDEHFEVTLNIDKLVNCKNIQGLLDLISEKLPK